MPSLRELQRDFAVALNEAPTAAGEPPAAVPAALARAITPSALTPAQRVQVYRNNYQTSLRDALAAVFPVLQSLVGEGFFAYLAFQYMSAHPSRSGNLHDFGIALPDFLTRFEAAASVPYVADVATKIASSGSRLEEMRRPRQSLEQVYLALTGAGGKVA